MLGLVLIAACHSETQQAETVPRNEFKLLVTAVDTASVLKALALDREHADKGIVYFFDTRDKVLQAHYVTLRGRQYGSDSGDSTVKLRAVAGSMKLSDEERALVIELDWTNEQMPAEARSLTRKNIKKDLVENVGSGLTPVAELFTDAQRRLVQARVQGVDWEVIKPYGPIEAFVWKRKAHLAGFTEPVTVELWQLRQDGRVQEILEVSAKARVKIAAEAQPLARDFFAAARAAGLGEPDGQTKTQQVMDFFQPVTHLQTE
jgi:hypothetical protein